ncbi:hypothetical protein WEH80_23880 [Actinomycetes bacterium KLBMP 9759]
MGATRSSTTAVESGLGAEGDLIAAAESLRWSRPDLTAALADHVVETVDADEHREVWLAAAGWAVHARSVTGDGRVAAAELLETVAKWEPGALLAPAAYRLRVELAMLALAAGEVDDARALVAPVVASGTNPELRADAYCALARCAAEDAPGEVADALRGAESAWSDVESPRAELASAATALVSAATARRAGQAAVAVAKAADGLDRLDRGRGPRLHTPSAHLAAALAAEWISALLDSGRVEEAHAGCAPLEPRLRENARPTRQVVRLRLAVARTLATGAADATEMLERAAREATESDAPDLEWVCCSALGALHEKSGFVEIALESMRLAVAAQMRDTKRANKFVGALQDVLTEEPEPTSHPAPAPELAVERTVVLPAVRHEPARQAPASPSAPAVPAPGTPAAAQQAPTNGRSKGSTFPAPSPAPANGLGDGVKDRSSKGRRSADAALQELAKMQGLSWLAASVNADSKRAGSRRAEPAPAEPATSSEGTEKPEPAKPTNGSSTETAQGGRRHRRAADPWTTGQWTPTPRGGRQSTDDAQPAPRVTNGGGRRRKPDPEPEQRPETVVSSDVPSLAPPQSAVERTSQLRAAREDPDGWLQAALAELDRVWGESPPEPVRPSPTVRAKPVPKIVSQPKVEPAGEPVREPVGESVGCSVVVDVSRDGRRFAGPRPAAVIRAIAERLSGRVPEGARLRHGDSDALSILLPGWERIAATRWMHSTLPEVMENFEAEDELPGAQLRAAVHDVDGQVGAQLLQRIDPPRPSGTIASNGANTTNGSSSSNAANGTPRHPAPRNRPDPLTDPLTGPLPEFDDEPVTGGGEHLAGAADGGGRHEVARTDTPGTEKARSTPTPGGRRHRNTAEEPQASPAPPPAPAPESKRPAPELSQPEPQTPTSTEGLGLADLLAGALAAYRGI